jgi:hypothetical protein
MPLGIPLLPLVLTALCYKQVLQLFFFIYYFQPSPWRWQSGTVLRFAF